MFSDLRFIPWSWWLILNFICCSRIKNIWMSIGHKNCYWQFSWLLFLFSVIIVICLLWSPFGKYYTKIMTSFGSKCHHLSKGSSPHLNGLLNIRKMVIYFNTLKTPFLTTYFGTKIFFSCCDAPCSNLEWHQQNFGFDWLEWILRYDWWK